MKANVLLGLALVALGGFLFTAHSVNLGPGFLFADFWPSMFVIPAGLFFHWLYFSYIRRGTGLLIPGGILLVAGIVCQISMLFDLWGIMWPGFIFAAAVGLFEFYWLGTKNKWLLIPINILTVLSALFFIVMAFGAIFHSLSVTRPAIAIVFIVLGVVVLFGKRREPRL